MTGPPLAGIRVLDLSTLLPGPLATLMLAEAGADVVKLERPGRGDEMRSYTPRFGSTSANYALLNRGKRVFAVDFKNPTERDRVLNAMARADIVVEQFRPGVADRLGLGYDDARRVNPDVIYCSITGYGPEGSHASQAGHDLNYLAESGLLNVVRDSNGRPPLPPTVIADIAGGTYPAIMNILLALRQRDLTGNSTHVQISMAHSLQVLAYGYLATYGASGQWPVPGRELLTGGSPRYRVYGTSDGRHVAVAALEHKFWDRLTELIGLPPELVDDAGREDEVMAAMEGIFGAEHSAFWRERLAGEDVCTVVVNTFEEAVAHGFVATGTPHRVREGNEAMPALEVPLSGLLRRASAALPAPELEAFPDSDVWE